MSKTTLSGTSLNKVEKFYVDQNIATATDKEIAKDLGKKVAVVRAYVASKTPEVSDHTPVEISDHFEKYNKKGSVAMTAAQSAVNDEQAMLNPNQNNEFYEKRLKGCIYKPNPNEPSF